MNLSGDGLLDGMIKIQKGQGISQAIAAELGLDENDCKKLGSIWNQIIDIAKEEESYEDGSKKYTEGMVLQDGDVFKFSVESFNKIINLVNGGINKYISPLTDSDSEDMTGDTDQDIHNSADEIPDISDDEIAEEVGLTEDKLPSVLLRNTGVVSAAIIYKAIKNPVYRKQVLPHLTKEQLKPFNDACKKFDEAKAARVQLRKNIQEGKSDVKAGKDKLKVVENAEKQLQAAQTRFDEARNQVEVEKNALKGNTAYQKLKQEFSEIDKQIKALEAKKANNKSKKLSPDNEAKLTELKHRKSELLKQKQELEKGLTEAKAKRTAAGKELKEAQYNNRAASAQTRVEEMKSKVNAETTALTANPEYKQAYSELQKVKSKIKTLETKLNSGTALSTAEQAELKGLKLKQQNLNVKIKELSKSLNSAKAELRALEAESRTVKSMANTSANAVKKSALSRVKKGTNKVRINLKKLPKSYIDTLTSGLSKTKAIAQAGGKVLRGAGKVAKPVMAILAAADIYNAYQTGGAKKAVRQTAKLGTSFAGAWAGGVAGAKAGAVIGGAIGSIIPGAGTAAGAAVGGFVGGIAGGIAGWWAGEKTYDAAERIVLPTDTQLGQEQAQNGELELEMTEEELREFLEEYPIPDDAIEWV